MLFLLPLLSFFIVRVFLQVHKKIAESLNGISSGTVERETERRNRVGGRTDAESIKEELLFYRNELLLRT